MKKYIHHDNKQKKETVGLSDGIGYPNPSLVVLTSFHSKTAITKKLLTKISFPPSYKMQETIYVLSARLKIIICSFGGIMG